MRLHLCLWETGEARWLNPLVHIKSCPDCLLCEEQMYQTHLMITADSKQTELLHNMSYPCFFSEKKNRLLHLEHWQAVLLSSWLDGNLLFPAVDGNYYGALSPWWALKWMVAKQTHASTPTDRQGKIQAHAESFTIDKSHPVVLRLKREGTEREGRSGGSLLLLDSVPLFFCAEKIWLRSL